MPLSILPALLQVIAMQYVAFAIPTPNASATSAAIDTLSSSNPASGLCRDVYHYRTLIGLVWSCLTTIFLCTWVTVHPNVPSNDNWTSLDMLDKILGSRTRRGLLCLMLGAPELVVALAYAEWTEACRSVVQLSSMFFSLLKCYHLLRHVRTIP
jgi:hypothetical protein